MSDITAAEVRESIAEAKTHLEQAAEHIIWQVQNKVWTVLGYTSWDAMRRAEYGGVAVMVPRIKRGELVGALHAEGLSQREIAATIGVGQKTVSRDVSHLTHVSGTRTDSLGRRQPTQKARSVSTNNVTQLRATTDAVEPVEDGNLAVAVEVAAIAAAAETDSVVEEVTTEDSVTLRWGGVQAHLSIARTGLDHALDGLVRLVELDDPQMEKAVGSREHLAAIELHVAALRSLLDG